MRKKASTQRILNMAYARKGATPYIRKLHAQQTKAMGRKKYVKYLKSLDR
jgi:hypothetical protein